MTLTVEVPKELEAKLEEEAKRNRVSRDEFVRIVLEENLNFKPPKPNFSAKIIATDLTANNSARQKLIQVRKFAFLPEF